MGLVLNEAAIKEMGLKDPIGKQLLRQFHIIGIIKDFNFQSLHSNIEPLAIGINSRWYRYLAIKISPQNITETITYIESIVSRFSPGFPFEYRFLDEEFDTLYQSENRLGKMFSYFSILAIFISSLGLLGLASFMVEKRTKEIGIRKVLGASVSRIFLLLSQEFITWIFISNLIAWPIGWYIVNLWLKNFAYKTPLDWWVFVLAGLITGIIALITISSQTIKLSLSNPIKALRYE
jgi:putative ABC transport system permease protein